MLLTEEEDSPVKAIDFGLAVFFDPKKLPRTDLGLEGTPHYMAPENLSSEVSLEPPMFYVLPSMKGLYLRPVMLPEEGGCV